MLVGAESAVSSFGEPSFTGTLLERKAPATVGAVRGRGPSMATKKKTSTSSDEPIESLTALSEGLEVVLKTRRAHLRSSREFAGVVKHGPSMLDGPNFERDAKLLVGLIESAILGADQKLADSIGDIAQRAAQHAWVRAVEEVLALPPHDGAIRLLIRKLDRVHPAAVVVVQPDGTEVRRSPPKVRKALKQHVPDVLRDYWVKVTDIEVLQQTGEGRPRRPRRRVGEPPRKKRPMSSDAGARRQAIQGRRKGKVSIASIAAELAVRCVAFTSCENADKYHAPEVDRLSKVFGSCLKSSDR